MKEKLQSAMKEAMRSKDKLALQAIRSLLSALQYEEMNKKVDSLSDEQSLQIIKSELKKQQESLEYAEKDGREDTINEIKSQIACIKSFLPEQLSEEKLKELIQSYIESNDDANVGKVMQYLKSDFNGQYDGKAASQLAKAAFG